jgi:hypothetical protein
MIHAAPIVYKFIGELITKRTFPGGSRLGQDCIFVPDQAYYRGAKSSAMMSL